MKQIIALIAECTTTTATEGSEPSPKKRGGLMRELEENASSGATGAASVATCVGGLGCGFDSSTEGQEKSIYGQKKPIMLKRNRRP